MGLRHLAVVSMRHEVLGIVTRKDLAILERNHALDTLRRTALARVRYILPDNCYGARLLHQDDLSSSGTHHQFCYAGYLEELNEED
jgi:CBS-domain-containing membrane protein